ncbi:hypothetical protein VP01_82g2 [Puccinia sorghi]|uniref:Uncharacterized protein n=1 Tax=Puccinia sorghi TaxID=27349 RepID=A0A0L6UBU4_9BASI|nr:hypothetical protein VP01_82g2 [Puccinia sorghi]
MHHKAPGSAEIKPFELITKDLEVPPKSASETSLKMYKPRLLILWLIHSHLSPSTFSHQILLSTLYQIVHQLSPQLLLVFLQLFGCSCATAPVFTTCSHHCRTPPTTQSQQLHQGCFHGTCMCCLLKITQQPNIYPQHVILNHSKAHHSLNQMYRCIERLNFTKQEISGLTKSPLLEISHFESDSWKAINVNTSNNTSLNHGSQSHGTHVDHLLLCQLVQLTFPSSSISIHSFSKLSSEPFFSLTHLVIRSYITHCKKNLINCMQLTCSILQPSFHPNSTCFEQVFFAVTFELNHLHFGGLWVGQIKVGCKTPKPEIIFLSNCYETPESMPSNMPYANLNHVILHYLDCKNSIRQISILFTSFRVSLVKYIYLNQYGSKPLNISFSLSRDEMNHTSIQLLIVNIKESPNGLFWMMWTGLAYSEGKRAPSSFKVSLRLQILYLSPRNRKWFLLDCFWFYIYYYSSYSMSTVRLTQYCTNTQGILQHLNHLLNFAPRAWLAGFLKSSSQLCHGIASFFPTLVYSFPFFSPAFEDAKCCLCLLGIRIHPTTCLQGRIDLLVESDSINPLIDLQDLYLSKGHGLYPPHFVVYNEVTPKHAVLGGPKPGLSTLKNDEIYLDYWMRTDYCKPAIEMLALLFLTVCMIRNKIVGIQKSKKVNITVPQTIPNILKFRRMTGLR